MEAIAKMIGIPKIQRISAEGLDIEEILAKTVLI